MGARFQQQAAPLEMRSEPISLDIFGVFDTNCSNKVNGIAAGWGQGAFSTIFRVLEALGNLPKKCCPHDPFQNMNDICL